MASATNPAVKVDACIRVKLAGHKQPRIWFVSSIDGPNVELKMAWHEGETFPVIGKSVKKVKVTALKDAVAYTDSAE